MRTRLKTVGVMGSGSDPHERFSRPLGMMLAEMGVHLLTGGGQGVMASVGEAFISVEKRAGLHIGILPGELNGSAPEAPTGYPNESVELPIRTHLPGRGLQGGSLQSRNMINIASSDAVIVLPGGEGTASEVRLCLAFNTPVIGFGGGGSREGIQQGRSLDDLRAFLEGIIGRSSLRG